MASVTKEFLTAKTLNYYLCDVSELQALTADNLTAFAGKIINFAVAISVGNNADLPSINKIELVGNNTQIKKEIFYSKVLKLSDESVGITDIDIAKAEESGGAVNIFASVKNDSDDWSDFVSVDKVSKKAKAIRFKAEVEVERSGISTAALNKIKIRHWQSGKSAAAEGKTILITKPYTLENNLNRAHAVIKFPKSADTNFKVYVVFGGGEKSFEMAKTATYERDGEVEENFEFTATDTTAKNVALKVESIQQSGAVENEVLGVGNGKQHAFKLSHNARPETLQVTGNNNWTYKEKTQTLLITAQSGNEISVSYDWIAKTTYLTALACVFNS